MPNGAFTGTTRFGVRGKLGEGAYGAVYEAWDSERKTRCALKLLRHVDAATIYRFKNEFRALSDVTHPNLCALHELIAVGDQWFFTMDLIDGVDFYTWVTSERRVDPADATVEAPLPRLGPATSGVIAIGAREMPADAARLRDALAQLTRGVSTVHAAGKLHCDLKPSNVLVTPEGRVVLLDFGLITELAPRLVEGSENRVAGTPAYMSPEQARAAVLTPASDWYAVGVMLYEALTGDQPFSGSLTAVLIGKQTRDPPPPAVLARSVPEDLAELAMALLSREAGERPTGDEILRRLGAARGRSSVRPSPDLSFVGREAQLSALRQARSRTHAGEGAVVALVTGPSGAGKSALIRRFLDEIEHDSSTVVLEGRCFEREVVPFKALDSLIDGLTRFLMKHAPSELAEILPPDIGVLARLFPVLGRIEAIASADPGEWPDPHELRRRAATALRELFFRMAETSGLVVFVDDLQWGDADSAAIFVEVLRAPSPPLLLVGSFRSDSGEPSAIVRALEAARGAADALVLPLAPLDSTEAADLARALLVGHPDSDVEAIARESGGSPLFILELARHHQQLGVSGAPRVGLVRLEDALIQRVERLPGPARRLLEVLSVVGRPIPAALAIEVCALEHDGWAALAELRTAKLVRTTQAGPRETAETHHDRIRDAVVSQLGNVRRKEIHHQVAVLLESASRVDPEALYAHFRAAGELESAAGYASFAALRAAGALAFDHAATLYRFAIDHGRGLDVSKLRVGLADALANAGRGAEAGAAYLLAAAVAEGDTSSGSSIELRRRGADSLLISGRIVEGVDTVRSVLRSVGLRWPASMFTVVVTLVYLRVILHFRGLRVKSRAAADISQKELLGVDVCWTVARGLSMFDPLRAVLFQTRGLLLALDAGDPARASRALSLAASFLVTEGPRGARAASEMIVLATQLAADLDDPHARGFARLVTGSMACMVGDWNTARDRCEEAAELLRDRCAGVPTEIATADAYVVTTAFYQGDLAAMVERTPRILDEALARGDLNAATLARTGHANARWLVRDDPDAARAELDEAMLPWASSGFLLPHYFELLACGQIDLYLGRGDLAAARVARTWSSARRAFLLRIEPLRIELFYLRGRASLANGELADAGRSASRLLSEGRGWATGMGELIRGGVAEARGDDAAARASFRAATAAFEGASMRAFALVARRRLSEMLGTSVGETDAALALRGVIAPARFTALFAPRCASTRRSIPRASE